MTSSSKTSKTSPKRSSTDRLTALLGNRSGRDIATLSTKLCWQPHSVRAALSRLRKTGVTIEKLPPARNGSGARYRIADEKQASKR